MLAALGLAIGLLFDVGRHAVAEEVVDVVEVHHYVAADGSPIFSQVIFWEFVDGRETVRDFRMLREGAAIPTWHHARDSAHCAVVANGRVIRVWGRAWRERWTDFDPEMQDRSERPVAERRRIMR